MNTKILETVIEELDAGKSREGDASNKAVRKPISTKIKKARKGRPKKMKCEKLGIEPKSNDKTELVVELPKVDKRGEQHTEKQTVNHIFNVNVMDVKAREESLAINEHETTKNVENHSESQTDLSRGTKVVEEGNAKFNEDDESSTKLFTRTFALLKKNTVSTKNDIIITPNFREDTKLKSDNKENILQNKKLTRSQEFFRSNSDRSLLTSRSETAISMNARNEPKFPKRLRPKSTSALSKKYLEAYLPRKSFFSSHDRVLREAGFQVDDAMKNKKRPNWRLILRMHTDEELNPDFGKETEQPATNEPQIKEGSDDEVSESINLMEAVETLISHEKEGQSAKRKLRFAAKKLGLEDKSDYKPLLDYLKYINDHPEEYMTMTRYTTKNMDYKHPSVMVRMARVFRKAHHGTARNNIFTHALAGLKPKFVEATAQRHGRAELGRTEFSTGKKEQGESPQEQSSASQDEGKSEIEKLKIKTEKWMGTLTTMQILKAKEYALKDVGEEDISVTKWWLAFKTCHYLRIPPTVIDQTL